MSVVTAHPQEKADEPQKTIWEDDLDQQGRYPGSGRRFEGSPRPFRLSLCGSPINSGTERDVGRDGDGDYCRDLVFEAHSPAFSPHSRAGG